jgi:lipid A 4'-phosphatase
MNRLRRHAAVLLACSIGAVFAAWPRLDLALAEMFYFHEQGFRIGYAVWIRLIYTVMAKLWILALVWILLLLSGFLPGFRHQLAPQRKRVAYLLAVLVLGPGLLVNTVLKDNWGRPRPVHLVQFGGTAEFTPMFQPSKQCKRNCSFVSGHAAAGFYPMAGFWVTRRRRWLVGGIAFGLLVGFARMAMGAHFLSDVLFAGICVYFTCRLLAYVFGLPEKL